MVTEKYSDELPELTQMVYSINYFNVVLEQNYGIMKSSDSKAALKEHFVLFFARKYFLVCHSLKWKLNWPKLNWKEILFEEVLEKVHSEARIWEKIAFKSFF